MNWRMFLNQISCFILLIPSGADSGFSVIPQSQDEEAVAMATRPLEQPEVHSQLSYTR